MLKLIKFITFKTLVLSCLIAHAEVIPPSETSISLGGTEKGFFERLKDNLGITYFSFFYGPGLHPDQMTYNPNQMGRPEHDGMYFQNQLSFRVKFSKNIALDIQTRFNVILNNYKGNSKFSPFLWETPRFGISGRLMEAGDWTLTGAINTDLPYFFPAPFTGYQAQQRTVVFNPGMFASLRWMPKGSRWSLFSVVSPRYFFYTDRSAAERQYHEAGYIPENKPEFILSFKPTINYSITPKISITLGTSIDYRKQVVSNWNLFNASLESNGNSTAWRLYAIPLTHGVTYTFSPAFSIYPFISTYPIAAQRLDAKTGRQATLLEATSIGMWLNGTLF